jgi:transposase
LFAAEGGRAVLVELSIMEQRYHAVMEVISGAPVAEVARRYGVSRQAVHGWLGRYEREGLAGLADHSHRPAHQPRQLDAQIEALICRMRGAHPRWGPRRLLFELGKAEETRNAIRSLVGQCRRGQLPRRGKTSRRLLAVAWSAWWTTSTPGGARCAAGHGRGASTER